MYQLQGQEVDGTGRRERLTAGSVTGGVETFLSLSEGIHN